MKKKFISTFLALCLLLSLLAVATYGAAGETFTASSNGIVVTYKVLTEPNNGQAGTVQVGDGTTIAVKQSTSSLTLPATVTNSKNGSRYDLIAIGDEAFYETDLSSVSMPDSIKSIGNDSFASCINLTLATLPSGLVTIGAFAFAYDSNLSFSVLPSSIKSIGTCAYEGCTKLRTLDCAAASAPSIGTTPFSSNVTIRVPFGATGYETGNWSAVNVVYDPTFTVAAPVFDFEKGDYTQPAAKTVTITNASYSTKSATITAAALTGTNANCFQLNLNGAVGRQIAPGGSDTHMTIRPNPDLSAGTYTATIAVTYNNTATATANVVFTVSPKDNATITFDDGAATYSGTEQAYEKATTADTTGGQISYTYAPADGGSLGSSGLPEGAGTYTVTARYESATAIGLKTAVFTINKATVTPLIASVAGKTYDGTTAATGTITLTGGQNGEQPAAIGPFAWTSPDAGTKTVNVQNIQIAEVWSKNYTLASAAISNGTAPGGVQISKATLTPLIASVAGKTYDGTTAATGTITLTGGQNGEQPTAIGAFSWTSPDAGTKTVNVQNIQIAEIWSKNYTLASAAISNGTAPGGVQISKATLTPYLEAISSKPYDGTAAATGVVGFAGVPNGDMPKVTYELCWGSIAVGTKIVKASKFTIDSGNYNALADRTFATPHGESITNATITIDRQPASSAVTAGCIIDHLTAIASASYDAATLHYVWYACALDKSAAVVAGTGSQYTLPADLSAGSHYFFCRVSTDGAMAADTDVAIVNVQPAAPDGITQVQETIAGKKDGTLKNANGTMEYSIDNGSSWESVAAGQTEITGFSGETVLVRARANGEVPAGASTVYHFVPSENLLCVDFDSNGGGAVANQALQYYAAASEPAQLKRDGFRFDSWLTASGETWNFRNPVTSPMTLYAKWSVLPIPDQIAAALTPEVGSDWTNAAAALLTAPEGYSLALDPQAAWNQSVTLPMENWAGKTVSYYLVYRVSGAIAQKTVKVPALETTISGATADSTAIAAEALTDVDKLALDNGSVVALQLTVQEITPTAADKATIEKVLQEGAAGLYLDVSIIKTVDGEKSHVTDLSRPIRITVLIPAKLLGLGHTYAVLRLHNGAVTELPDLDNDPATYTFATDKFSTYALAYVEQSEPAKPIVTPETMPVAVPTSHEKPITADTTPIIFYGVLIGAAGVGLICFAGIRKKNKQAV
ncbi:MAG: leucine-rich repeat protein [Oscillibacter sp.]|nr:leucine-rich repeat protein [Oscillibacter sp.]